MFKRNPFFFAFFLHFYLDIQKLFISFIKIIQLIMKHDIYRARNEARKILDRSAKTEIVQLISSMTGTSQAEIIKNADKIKLSDILELELVQDAYFTWEMWRDLQLATPDVNLT